MMNDSFTTETRPVRDFDQVEVKDPTNQVKLVISPGEEECLLIEASQAMIGRIATVVQDGVLRISLQGSLADKLKDAVTTSLTRERVTYCLTVKELTEVRIKGLVKVDVEAMGEERPVIKSALPVPPVPPV